MSASGKSKVTARIYYVFPPKGFETSPNQVTRDQVKKYLSGKPLRLGPDRWAGIDPADGTAKADPRPEGQQPTDPGTP